MGTTIHTEKLNYVAWQKNWPRSIRDRAPGMFIEQLRSKAESAGGALFEYSTYTTALSQTCLCGTVKKKKLSERTHRCDCGITAQRDLFSAFLGTYVTRTITAGGHSLGLLDASHAHAAWITSHDIDWLPASPRKHHNRQGRRTRPTRRSAARINARRNPGAKRQSLSEENLAHLVSTALPIAA